MRTRTVEMAVGAYFWWLVLLALFFLASASVSGLAEEAGKPSYQLYGSSSRICRRTRHCAPR
jgi:ABC-type transporter Mla subunit MlaD